MKIGQVYYAHVLGNWKLSRCCESGRATLAWRQDEDDYTRIGFALCSPKDNYIRAVGRQLALEMLETNPLCIPITGALTTPRVCALLRAERYNNSHPTFERHAPAFWPRNYRN